MTPNDAKQLIESTANLTTTYFGSRTSALGVEEHIGLPDDHRWTHVLNIGATGSGKSVLLTHVALQDAIKGHGLCIINPKGGLLDEFIAKLPADRVNDIVYINPAAEQVTPINVLEPHITAGMTQAHRENQKEIIVSDLIDLFKRQSEHWGDQFGRVLETLLRAHLDRNIQAGEQNTLLDVFRCVIQDDALTDLIDRTTESVVREQLVRIKEDMSTYDLEPLQRRLNDFVMNATIRRVISAPESGIVFRDAMAQGKIILVDVQKGAVGETVAQLVGSIVLTKIWAAAQSRVTQPIEDRAPYYLFVDELQTFAGDGSNFTKMLSEAREYRLGLWIATQYLTQLPTEMQRAVVNNCRTKVVLQPEDAEDGSRIANMLLGVNRTQLSHLGNYRAVLQQPADHQRHTAIIFDTYPPWDADHTQVDAIKQKQTVATTASPDLSIGPSLGRGANSGGDTHAALLAQAKAQLEERGITVTLLYQDEGADKPDGHVHMPDGSIAHLEAEHSTLSKPAKVLTNLHRAALQGRDVILVIEGGKAAKLQNIVSDPVNRRGTDHEDENGTYSYYTDSGDPFTAIDELAEVDYRILEISTAELVEQTEGATPDCPELSHSKRDDLETFCLYRDEHGFCTALETPCTLLDGD